jgi:chromosome segregation ATPase
MASRRRRRSCKYGKLKRKTKGRRCRKSRRRSRKSVCKASVPSSITNYQNQIADLTRTKVSLNKRIVSANAAVSSATDPVKKLQKSLVVAKLQEHLSKVLAALDKAENKLVARMMKFSAKNKVSSALAADETARFGKVLAKIEK